MSAPVRAAGLGVCFWADAQRRPLTRVMRSQRRHVARSWGLRDVSFDARPGDGIALIGSSGSGKTSLLRAIAGVYPADAGSVHASAPLAALLSTEGGLLSTLTGRENAELLGVLSGLSRGQARARAATVRDLSRLGDDFERVVSGYSQGMRARLGFAAMAREETRVLLLDEVHEAFDHEFREVLAARASELMASGGVVIAAGHDHPLLASVCGRAILLEDGTVSADGPFEQVRSSYLA